LIEGGEGNNIRTREVLKMKERRYRKKRNEKIKEKINAM
jgi:hypothetical protein